MVLIEIEEVENAIDALGIKVLEIPREALFLTGRTFIKYRKSKGIKKSPLPDFFIGAHASVSQFGLVTRDLSKYKTYFPQVQLFHP
ncbi:type II toxin-antitoxin system VapC family toxin [Candidatus Thiosymbion oneisti]|uniref:type II toxin-antitoxin system VapC family toxin n=1 Tax=Candidatus Thiosymbion oneisti TaxID=589554 RepID=UPI001A9C6FD5|nr:type II toxin-antitoxin system VapC family toxin [Candidatus Thiosymbion oneisti]